MAAVIFQTVTFKWYSDIVNGILIVKQDTCTIHS